MVLAIWVRCKQRTEIAFQLLTEKSWFPNTPQKSAIKSLHDRSVYWHYGWARSHSQDERQIEWFFHDHATNLVYLLIAQLRLWCHDPSESVHRLCQLCAAGSKITARLVVWRIFGLLIEFWGESVRYVAHVVKSRNELIRILMLL